MRKVGKKIIDAENMIVSSPLSGSKYIRIQSKKEDVNTLEVKEMRLVGKIKGVKEEVELVFDRKMFFDWIDKLKTK